ncbi:MAG: cyanophycinase [Bacteroidales bacterium]
MKYTLVRTLALVVAVLNFSSISLAQKSLVKSSQSSVGHLFIIGGGEKTEGLMKELLKVSAVGTDDYVIILPMSSEDPDSSVIFAQEDFASVGIKKVVGFNFTENGPVSQSRLDSMVNAKLIFITGGDQSRFMKIVGKGPIYKAIHEAYKKGSTIAGTSAGAAVMSKKMITGNTLKHPENSGRYPTIEPGNIEVIEGLGMLDKLIIDQHFIKRQRLNRLISVLIENPDETCVGIDESTAIIVTGNSFTVAGENQVVVLRNQAKNKKIHGNLLGAKGLQLDVLLPGETWHLK